MSQARAHAEPKGVVSKIRKPQAGEKLGISGIGADETDVSGSHRLPLQFRAKPVAYRQSLIGRVPRI